MHVGTSAASVMGHERLAWEAGTAAIPFRAGRHAVSTFPNNARGTDPDCARYVSRLCVRVDALASRVNKEW